MSERLGCKSCKALCTQGVALKMETPCWSFQMQHMTNALQASMQHTDCQMQDILYLRQLFYHKLGQLARQRRALLTSMSQCKIDMSHVSEKFSAMSKWSYQLRENGFEEYRAYLQYAYIFYRGVGRALLQCLRRHAVLCWLWPTLYRPVTASSALLAG